MYTSNRHMNSALPRVIEISLSAWHIAGCTVLPPSQSKNIRLLVAEFNLSISSILQERRERYEIFICF